MNKAIFIPVRLSSTRFPRKAIKKLDGKTCLEYLINRIKQIKNVDLIVLCTTTELIDDKLEELAEKLNIECFRGSKNDILKRYLDASEQFKVDLIINVDGDDIFCELDFIEITLNEMTKMKNDIIIWKNMPIGTTPIGIKVDAIKKICSVKDVNNTDTGWLRLFTKTHMFKVKYLTSYDPEKLHPNLRLTLDYPQDLEFFKKILEKLCEPIRLKDIVKLVKNEPKLLEINSYLSDMWKKNFEMKSTKIKIKDLDDINL